MKKVVSFLFKPLSVIIIVSMFYYVFSLYLDSEIDKLYEKNKQYSNHSNGLPEKDKGNILIEKGSSEANLLIMGSSELESQVPENPKFLFPNNLYGSDASFVGHASVQNALHAINLGANYKKIKHNDIMIVESLQWFMGYDIDSKGFLANFSELQFYEFLHNNKISSKNKNYLCKRYIQIENESASLIETPVDDFLPYDIIDNNITYNQTYVLAKLYSSDKLIDKVLYQITRPYYWLRYQILRIKDKYHSYKWLKQLNSSNQAPVNLNWDEMYLNAEKEGEEASTNNNLFVRDDYYTEYLEADYDDLKNYQKDVVLLDSKEWNDFKFLLDVCEDLNIRPYIVIMSTNGLYYDYIGITKQERDDYYNQMEKIAIENGFDVLNLKNYEYTPYFYCDVMHLGWKGWPYVIQNTIEYFKK